MSATCSCWRSEARSTVPERLIPPRGWFILAGLPLAIFFVLYGIPVLHLFRVSFDQYDPNVGILPAVQAGFYAKFLGDPYYLSVLWRTVRISLATTAICALVGYPISYYLVRSSGWRQTVLLIVLLLPLVTSVIVVSYGWLILLGREGLVNTALLRLHLTARPLKLMYSETGILIGLVQVQLVFMVLSVAASLRDVDANLPLAARSLGAGPWRSFRLIVLPLSLPGLRTGALLVFSLSMSAYAIPALIGGPRVKVLSYLIYEQSISLLNWPFAATMAVILLASTSGVLGLASAYGQWRAWRERQFHRPSIALREVLPQ
jgi:putative spermidine/putrescine transport system permease protein